jgi:hypothetical protein
MSEITLLLFRLKRKKFLSENHHFLKALELSLTSFSVHGNGKSLTIPLSSPVASMLACVAKWAQLTKSCLASEGHIPTTSSPNILKRDHWVTMRCFWQEVNLYSTYLVHSSHTIFSWASLSFNWSPFGTLYITFW